MADNDMAFSVSISFVRTFIPKDSYKDKEEVKGLLFCHFDPVYKESMGGYDCVECSVPAGTFDETMIESAYGEWKKKQANSELAYVIRRKISEIETYDVSSKVNGFSLNGNIVWLDKATRVGLMNSTTIAKAAGQSTTTLWLGEIKLEVECDKVIQLLSALEMYALECFNVTAAHKKAVSKLTSIEDVEEFDITADYPKQLEMTV